MSNSQPNVNGGSGGPDIDKSNNNDAASSITNIKGGLTQQINTTTGQQLEYAVDDNITVFKESVAVSQEAEGSNAMINQIKRAATHLVDNGQDFTYEKQQEINEYAEQIQECTEDLQKMVDGMLQRQQCDFVSAYKEHMQKVNLELINCKKKTSEFYLKMQEDERIAKADKQRQWFQKQSTKMADNIDQLKESVTKT